MKKILLLALGFLILVAAPAYAVSTFSTFTSTTYSNATDKIVGWRAGTPNTNITFPMPFVSLTTTGTSGAATLSGGVLNVPQYSSSTFQQSMAAQTQLSLGGL